MLGTEQVVQGCQCSELPSSRAFVLVSFSFELFELRRAVTYVAMWRERADRGVEVRKGGGIWSWQRL